MKYGETWRNWLTRLGARTVWEFVLPADKISWHAETLPSTVDDLRDMQVIGAERNGSGLVIVYNARKPAGAGMVFMELNVDDPREAFELLTRDREQYANQNQARHTAGQKHQPGRPHGPAGHRV